MHVRREAEWRVVDKILLFIRDMCIKQAFSNQKEIDPNKHKVTRIYFV